MKRRTVQERVRAVNAKASKQPRVVAIDVVDGVGPIPSAGLDLLARWLARAQAKRKGLAS